MTTFKIGQVIQEKRKARQLTQSELAYQMGISKSSVSKWETGQTYPDIYLLPELATYFSITVDELLGYTPQLTKIEIREHYVRLAKAFSSEPFSEVLAECRALIKKYYACLPFLLQMCVLLVNHANLTNEKEQTEILHEAIELVQRVKTETTDSRMVNQAISFEASCQMFLGKPTEVLELLGEDVSLYFGNELLMANAFKMLGQTDKSTAILQVNLYQQLMGALSTSGQLLQSQIGDVVKFDQTITRMKGLVETFGIAELHPFLLVTSLVEIFMCYTQQNRLDLAVGAMKEMLSVLETITFPAHLHGDAYFDLLDSWIDDQLELSSTMPRNEQVVKESLSSFFKETSLLQDVYGEHQEYQELLKQLEVVLS